MHMLHGAGFFPMPVEQLGSVPVQVGEHGMMMPVTAIIKERPLGLEQTQSNIAKGFAIFLFPSFTGDKIHFGPLPPRPVGFGGKGLPLRHRQLSPSFSPLNTP